MTKFIYKIYDEDCPVCQSMEAIEREVYDRYGVEFPKLTVEHATQYEELFSYLDQNVAEDGELPLPCYLRLVPNGRPVYHLCGEQTIESLLALCEATR